VSFAAFAPAKVNLFLHVGPLRPDGFHPVCSLMAFTDVGDRLTYRPEEPPGLVVEGPFAADLAGTDSEDNLVMRAARRLLELAGAGPLPGRLVLEKALPAASGLGGGSGDAGAALRLLRRALGLSIDDAGLEAIAAELGSDGPACLWARPVLAEGRGERLIPAPASPPLPAVLVNPRAPSPTGAVYRAFDASPPGQGADRPALTGFADAASAAAFLEGCRNDLEAPAAGLVPEIAAVLAWLRGRPETLLARLSGSGATCFALCPDEAAAAALARAASAERPGWWARACRLGAPSLDP